MDEGADYELRRLERAALAGDAEALERLKRAWLFEHGVFPDEVVEELRRRAVGGCAVLHGVGCHYKVPSNYCGPCRAKHELEVQRQASKASKVSRADTGP